MTPSRELHVSLGGDDANPGTAEKPLRTISAAAVVAEAGDTVTVHAGVYRERIDPPRGGTSDDCRIVYQAAPGERVEIAGSEVVAHWQRVARGVWQAILPNSFFGTFNPFATEICGDWFDAKGRKHHRGAVYLDGEEIPEGDGAGFRLLDPSLESMEWIVTVDANETTIKARFGTIDPNAALVEVAARPTVFYPSKPGIHFLTVRGFVLRHAATPWAPPTAEQIGLLGTHWSRGWRIENNEIHHSRCAGITLGKYGDSFDNASANSAEGYVNTIRRALECGWNEESVGSHFVLNNHIHHCEQAGIVGSMGAAFSEISGNTIHDIHRQRLFDGAEQGGIKLHGAVDVRISQNHIFRTPFGIWLDWMGQGTHISGNCCHDNSLYDLFLEVNHGPILIDNNVFLSPGGVFDRSQGTAFVHNVIVGFLWLWPDLERSTPYLHPHRTSIAGFSLVPGGDARFLNNLIGDREGFAAYSQTEQPCLLEGNVFLRCPPACRVDGDALGMELEILPEPARTPCQRITPGHLGQTLVSQQDFIEPGGCPTSSDPLWSPSGMAANPVRPGPILAAGGVTGMEWSSDASSLILRTNCQ